MIEILYQDNSLLVCVKPAGLISEDSEAKNSLPRTLREQLAQSEKSRELYTLHRLDREVCGVIVLAKTRAAAAKMSQTIADGKMEKNYLAVVHGKPKESQARLVNLLFKDSAKNKTYVVDRKRAGVREAALKYTTLASRNDTSLLAVTLETGRSHQIRAQLSHIGHPILADRKYGSRLKAEGIALCSHSIEFEHPDTNERVRFCYTPHDAGLWADYADELCSM